VCYFNVCVSNTLVVALVSSSVRANVIVPCSDLFVISFSSKRLRAIGITELVTYANQNVQMHCNKAMRKYRPVFL
jgi:hypothetical protein